MFEELRILNSRKLSRYFEWVRVMLLIVSFSFAADLFFSLILERPNRLYEKSKYCKQRSLYFDYNKSFYSLIDKNNKALIKY